MRTLRMPLVGVMTLALLGGQGGIAMAQMDPTSRPPIPSAGCGGSQIEPGTYRSDQAEPLVVGGAQKKWAMHVPEAHDGTSALPLWVQLHGVGGSGSSQVAQFRSSADEHGFVLAAPTEFLGNAGWTWREEDLVLDTSLSNPDIAFINALLRHLEDDLCIDLARIYVAGYSGGGEGASVLGCVLEDRIAAVAPAAAMLDVGDACELDRPVPFLGVHGTADSTAYFDGGYSPGYNDFPVVLARAQTSIPDRVTNVALRNGCGPDPAIEAIDSVSERWSWSCPPGAEVELIVHSGGHSPGPPGTTDIIWDFFEQHPMPE